MGICLFKKRKRESGSAPISGYLWNMYSQSQGGMYASCSASPNIGNGGGVMNDNLDSYTYCAVGSNGGQGGNKYFTINCGKKYKVYEFKVGACMYNTGETIGGSIQGSNDGSSGTTLGGGSSGKETSSSVPYAGTLTVSNPQPYQYYRMVATGASGGGQPNYRGFLATKYAKLT